MLINERLYETRMPIEGPAVLNDDIIKSRIYSLRSQQVMLDEDLAGLYGVETRALNQAVKRNMERFPSNFMNSIL